MKICQPCWEKLKLAIEQRGLMHLVAKSGEAAAAIVTRQLAENPPLSDRSAYDPLMAANFAIWRQALSAFGLEMMAEDAPCPLCYKTKLESSCTDPDCSKQTGDQWIEFAAQDQLDFARAQGFVPAAS